MNVRTLILAILNFQEATGYEIKKLSTEGVYSYFVEISYGSIYPTLSKLETDDMVTVRTEAQDGKPDRKVYAITDAGRMEFAANLATPPALDKFKSEFLLVALTAELGTAATITKAIDDRIADLENKRSMIEDALNNVLETKTDKDCASNWVCHYGLAIKNFDIKYLKEHRDTLIASAGIASAGKNNNKQETSVTPKKVPV